MRRVWSWGRAHCEPYRLLDGGRDAVARRTVAKAETDRAGRVRVLPDLSVPGRPEVFVVGDTASLDQDGKPLPGVAQVAMQQGRYVGRSIARRVTGQRRPGHSATSIRGIWR